MLRLLLVISAALGAGAVLASGATTWPVRPGYLGAAAMLAGAFGLRRAWRARAENAPGSPEQALWFATATYALVASYLAATLVRVGPHFVLHTPAGHALGIDTWTLAIAGLAGWLVARNPDRRRDERDVAIAMNGLRWGFGVQITALLAVATLIGYGWLGAGDWSTAVTAHVLILVAIASCLVDSAVRLRAYVADAHVE